MRLFVSLLIFSALLLSSCASVKDRDRVGVREAKACIKTINSQKIILDTFKLHACTNNGVWIAENLEKNERYDFLNKELITAKNETFEFSDLDTKERAEILSLHKKINEELLDLY